MNKFILLAFTFLTLSLVMPTKAMANQYGQYGGVVIEKKLSIDKKVLQPVSKGEAYVDNLFASQYLFAPDEVVKFEITVTNTGNTDELVKVKDILPKDYLYPYDSQDFSINSNSQDLEKDIDLKAGESKSFYFKAKFLNADKLPQASGYYCVYNTAQTWVDSTNQVFQDTAQVCVEKRAPEVKGGFDVVTELPKAGPADNLAILLGSIIFGFSGIKFLKKK